MSTLKGFFKTFFLEFHLPHTPAYTYKHIYMPPFSSFLHLRLFNNFEGVIFLLLSLPKDIQGIHTNMYEYVHIYLP